MSTLVTGGAGFIGSNLTRALLERGEKVYVVDDFSTGDLGNIPDGPIIYTDLYDALSELGSEVDAICHFGAPSNTLLYRDDQNCMWKAIRDFTTILNHAKVYNTKIVYASTSSMYQGWPIPWCEDMTVYPVDFYTETRIFWERVASVYNQFYGVKSVGMRMFSVYGEREEYKRNYANILTQMLWAKQRGETFEIWGDGTQMRDSIYVGDVIRAWMLAIDAPIKCEVFNVGTGKSYTFNEMAGVVGVSVKHIDVPIKNYVHDHKADTTKARGILGFEAAIDIDEGISLLKEYYDSILPATRER